MNSEVSGSEHYMQRLKALGGSENDVTEPHYLLTQNDTVESVVSHLVMEQRARGRGATDPAILHAAAEFLISTRNEHASGHGPAALQQGQYQLDIHCGGAGTTRESIPVKDLADAKVWAQKRIEAHGAIFGAIYFPAGHENQPGMGALVSSFDRSVGWYR